MITPFIQSQVMGFLVQDEKHAQMSNCCNNHLCLDRPCGGDCSWAAKDMTETQISALLCVNRGCAQRCKQADGSWYDPHVCVDKAVDEYTKEEWDALWREMAHRLTDSDDGKVYYHSSTLPFDFTITGIRFRPSCKKTCSEKSLGLEVAPKRYEHTTM